MSGRSYSWLTGAAAAAFRSLTKRTNGGKRTIEQVFEMNEGVIRAAPHVHMHPDDAAFYEVKNGDFMKLRIGGPVAITLERLLVRVSKDFKLEVHIDTDEGNACGLQPETPVELAR